MSAEDEKGANKLSYNKVDPTELINPTATKIIEITGKNSENVAYRYNYGDFALAKYFGKIPNNQMLTLRRFAFPCADDIISPMELNADGVPTKTQQPDIARAVTWMGEVTENNIKEILGFKA
jgi:hypothetical protein